MPDDDKEWGFENADGDFINPVKCPGAQTQFSQCPGPNEKVTLTFAPNHLWMDHRPLKKIKQVNADKGKPNEKVYGSMLFVTSVDVKKNQQ